MVENIRQVTQFSLGGGVVAMSVVFQIDIPFGDLAATASCNNDRTVEVAVRGTQDTCQRPVAVELVVALTKRSTVAPSIVELQSLTASRHFSQSLFLLCAVPFVAVNYLLDPRMTG